MVRRAPHSLSARWRGRTRVRDALGLLESDQFCLHAVDVGFDLRRSYLFGAGRAEVSREGAHRFVLRAQQFERQEGRYPRTGVLGPSYLR